MPRRSVAIIGRPNVGKSTLFNRLLGRRVSIEDPLSGVTRDRVLHPLTVGNRSVDLVDTGGIGIVDRKDLARAVEAQVEAAMRTADVIVFLVDSREGVTPLDEEVARRLRVLEKPVVLAASKADTAALDEERHAFHSLGFGEPLAVSAHQNRGIRELLQAVLDRLPSDEGPEAEEPETLKIAFVGKRNAGKSSLINRLAGEERVIVSDRPGTTRDSIDVLFERDGARFLAIDTAGLRRRGRVDDAVEFYAQVRSERAVRRADVVVLLIDASVPLSKVDKRIARLIGEEAKPCILAVNKWDLARLARPEITPEEYHKYLLSELPWLHFAPIAATSALTGENVWGLIRLAQDLDRQARRCVGTGELNRALQRACEKESPPRVKGRALKIYYATQSALSPPTFLLFCNDPSLAEERYTRYLIGQFRQTLGFEEIPLRLEYRASHKERPAQ
ncbi:MAG: ribosome biogenesis GTPase Der [Planctomycetota bacterium]